MEFVNPIVCMVNLSFVIELDCFLILLFFFAFSLRHHDSTKFSLDFKSRVLLSNHTKVVHQVLLLSNRIFALNVRGS